MDIVQRAKNICLTPATEWAAIEAETTSTGQLIMGYAAPLAAIPAIAGFIGGSLLGLTPFVGYYRVPIIAGFVSAVLGFGLTLVGIFVLSLVIDALAPTFGGQKNSLQALKVAVYCCTPAWLAGVLNIVPLLGILGIFAALYGLYLLYLGLPRLMKCPEDKAIPYTAVVVVCAIVLAIVIGAIGGIFLGAGMVGRGAFASAAASSDVHFDKNSPIGQLQAISKKM